MAAFDDCLANLREVWNVGVPYSARITRPAQSKRPLRDLFRSSTYPAQAMREGDTGRVGRRGRTASSDDKGGARDLRERWRCAFSVAVFTAERRHADGNPGAAGEHD